MNQLKKDFLLEASKVILGKEKELTLALCAFLANGHILIEDIPGVGKTTFAKTISKILNLSFSRIQFTSDLMPSDILGAQIYNQKEQNFYLFKGPIFNQFILADELNRGNPKTQSALLEAMEERQVSIDNETFPLSEFFFIIATQNPNTQIGTYLLPESQLDRFMIRIKLGYPHPSSETKLIQGFDSKVNLTLINKICSPTELNEFRSRVNKIKISDKLAEFILNLLDVSRSNQKFYPLSPRAGIDIAKMTKAYAFLDGREYALPDDVKAILDSVINHRIGIQNNLQITDSLLSYVKVD